MKYLKSPLTYEEQANLLLKRGLLADKDSLEQVLSKINYYRLSAYWKQYQDKDENFYKDTNIDDIMYFYEFDEKLRIIIFNAIARIEVYLKTAFANKAALFYGNSFFYLNINNLPKFRDKLKFNKLIGSIAISCRNSKELYFKHFKTKYGDYHDFPPIWMLIEMISFGTFCKLFSSIDFSLGKKISWDIDLNYSVMNSWVWSINEARNICAHHSRLWNRTLGNKPLIPQKKNLKEWYEPRPIKNDKISAIIFILLFVYERAQLNTNWFNSLIELLNLYPKIPIHQMGFDDDWQKNPIIMKALTVKGQ